MKKTFIIFMLLCLFLPQWVLGKTINLRGFGQIDVQPSGANYNVNLGKLGSFEFQGDIQGGASFNLTAEIPLPSLKKFPGYKVLSLLKLEKIVLSLSPEGLTLSSRIKTNGKLKTLFSFLKIKEPYMDITAGITRESIDLAGSLVPGEKGITINLIPKLGTAIKFKSLELAFTFEFGRGQLAPVIEITGFTEFRPTKWDKFLNLINSISYDLLTQQISIAGTLKDTWKDPFKMSRFLKGKKSILIQDAALEIGWIPGAPAPTKIGIMTKRMDLFGIAFGFALDMNPTKGKVAFWAQKDKFTLNELSEFIRNGFGIPMPDIFPSSLRMDDIEVLFSPAGGSVGALEIEKGFKLKGKAAFGSVAKGYLDIWTDLEEEFHFAGGFDNNFKELVLKKLRKRKTLKKIMGVVLKTFSIKKVHLLLHASLDKVRGGVDVDLTVLGKRITFKGDASFNPEKIADIITDKIEEYGLKYIKIAAAKVAKYTKQAYGKTKTFTVGAAKKVWSAMSDFGKKVKHKFHSYNKCYKTCTPNYAKNAGKKLYSLGADSMYKFASEVKGTLKEIEGATKSDTRNERMAAIRKYYDLLNKDLSAQFTKIKNDQHVRGFYSKKSSKNKGERKYEGIIDDYIKKFNDYRTQCINAVLDGKNPPKP